MMPASMRLLVQVHSVPEEEEEEEEEGEDRREIVGIGVLDLQGKGQGLYSGFGQEVAQNSVWKWFYECCCTDSDQLPLSQKKLK